MKQLLSFVVVLCVCLYTTQTTYAQSNTDVEDAQVILQLSNPTILNGPNAIDLFALDSTQIDSLYATQNVDVRIAVKPLDVTTVSNVHVRLGRSSTTFDIFNDVLAADGSNLPQGVTLELRSGIFYINLGEHFNAFRYLLEVQVEDTNGTISPIYTLNKL